MPKVNESNYRSQLGQKEIKTDSRFVYIPMIGTNMQITNPGWISQLQTNSEGKKMFKKIKDWFFDHVINKINYNFEHYQSRFSDVFREIARLEEELHIHKQLTNCPKTAIIRSCHDGKFNHNMENYMERDRCVLRDKGYKYFTKKNNGDEVWVEDPNFGAPKS